MPVLRSFLILFSFFKLREVLPAPIDLRESGQTFFEGDISGFGFDPSIRQTSIKLNDYVNKGIIDENMRWPNGIVPYVYSYGFDENQKSLVSTAMEGISSKTCIRFVVREFEDDYLQLTPGKSCYSRIGKVGGPQTVGLYIAGDIEIGVIQHGLLHAIGLYHEQARSDRDKFVDINRDNIPERDQNNFLIYNDQIISEFSEEYDFGSVMHHGQFSFARNPDVWTIKPKDEYNEFEEIMGQRRTLSVMDAKKVNTIYKCSVPAGRRSGSLTTRAKTIQQVVKKTSRIQVTQAPTTTEEPTTVDTTDEAQPYEPETTTPTTTTTKKPKPPTSTRRNTKPVVITEAPDEDTDERKVKTASSSIVRKVGEEGERTFWWTGLPPDFYKPPRDAQEFYPWKTNGVMIFNGEKRIVTSGFRTGLHPNGSHWRTNWFKWQYPEEFFATTLPPSDELQMDDMASDRDSSKLDLMQSDEADKLISGRKGSLTFRWTGPPPDFYKRPRNKHEFYPWLTNGVITFRGQQRRVSSGFDSGIYANGTKWRRNWYEWSSVEG